MSDVILFICIFSITCGFLKISNPLKNKKLINYGLLALFMWFAIFAIIVLISTFFGIEVSG